MIANEPVRGRLLLRTLLTCTCALLQPGYAFLILFVNVRCGIEVQESKIPRRLQSYFCLFSEVVSPNNVFETYLARMLLICSFLSQKSSPSLLQPETTHLYSQETV